MTARRARPARRTAGARRSRCRGTTHERIAQHRDGRWSEYRPAGGPRRRRVRGRDDVAGPHPHRAARTRRTVLRGPHAASGPRPVRVAVHGAHLRDQLRDRRRLLGRPPQPVPAHPARRPRVTLDHHPVPDGRHGHPLLHGAARGVPRPTDRGRALRRQPDRDRPGARPTVVVRHQQPPPDGPGARPATGAAGDAPHPDGAARLPAGHRPLVQEPRPEPGHLRARAPAVHPARPRGSSLGRA